MKRWVSALVLLSAVVSNAQTNQPVLTLDSHGVTAAGKKPTLDDVTLVCWTNGLGHNGHWYEAVCVGPDGISWDGAKAVADVKGGYLAVVTSKEENDFVFHLIDKPKYWYTQWNLFWGPWIGGYRDASSTNAAEGWKWVGERDPFIYSNWTVYEGVQTEPNNWNNQNERYVQFYGYDESKRDFWNDAANDVPVRGFVIEYDKLKDAGKPTDEIKFIPLEK